MSDGSGNAKGATHVKTELWVFLCRSFAHVLQSPCSIVPSLFDTVNECGFDIRCSAAFPCAVAFNVIELCNVGLVIKSVDRLVLVAHSSFLMLVARNGLSLPFNKCW